MGFEPTISCLGSKRSTTELHPLDLPDYTASRRQVGHLATRGGSVSRGRCRVRAYGVAVAVGLEVSVGSEAVKLKVVFVVTLVNDWLDGLKTYLPFEGVIVPVQPDG